MRHWIGAWPPLAAAAVTLLAIGLSGACHSGGESAPGCPSAEGTPVDAPTMAFLSMARALHHEADLQEERGDERAAIAALERLVAAPAPAGPETDEVRADAYARLGELRLKGGDLVGADGDVQAGLTWAHEVTYFRGHLLEVGGLIEEARAAKLADAGSLIEVARARTSAIDRLEAAVHIQQQVIEHSLVDGGHDE
jgi:hypothetical protein